MCSKLNSIFLSEDANLYLAVRVVGKKDYNVDKKVKETSQLEYWVIYSITTVVIVFVW